MNGFADHGLDEGAFGEKTGNIVKAFDAFRTYYISPSLFWDIGAELHFKLALSFPSLRYMKDLS